MPTRSAFLESLLAAAGSAADELTAAVCESLQRKWDDASSAWPGLTPDPATYGTRLWERAALDAEPVTALQSMDWADLILVGECVRGEDDAVRHLDRSFGPGIERAARRVPGFDEPADQFRAQLIDNLLEQRPDAPPRLDGYSGRGTLAGWLRVVTVRQARNALRSRGPEVPVEGELMAELEAAGDDPELDYLKNLYRDHFKQAFEDAVAQLSRRERNLLRHSVIDGLNVDQIGRIYHVHRSTAARQLEKARAQLRDATRQILLSRLQVAASQLQSIARLVESQLDVSVKRVLGGNSDH